MKNVFSIINICLTIFTGFLIVVNTNIAREERVRQNSKISNYENDFNYLRTSMQSRIDSLEFHTEKLREKIDAHLNAQAN